MDGHGERNSPKEAPNNTEMLLAFLSHSEELRKGNRKPKQNKFIRFYTIYVAQYAACDHKHGSLNTYLSVTMYDIGLS